MKVCYYFIGGNMQRYFVKDNQIKDNQVLITGNDFHHMKNVMRFKVGQKVNIVTYSGKLFLTQISKFSKNDVDLTIVEELENKNDILNVTIAQALIKKDKFELVLQKTTELGVKKIIPLMTKNSIIKIDNYDKKKVRYQTIVKEASEQSERNFVTEIGNLTSVQDIDFYDYDYVFTAYARQESNSLLKEINSISKDNKVLVLVGPEGGFSNNELEYLESKSKLISLGSTILRSETAAIYIASAFRLIWEN